MKSIVILISGRGSNMQALIEAQLPAKIAAVISNRADAKGLEIAAAHGIATEVVPHRGFASRVAFDTALLAAIDAHRPDLVVLAGFMRVLSAEFVNHFRGRLVNIHPSLLPAFPGVDTHRRALQAHVKWHGCTVHLVDEEVDEGPIILQARVPVLPGDDEATLAARVLEQEHVIYPRAVQALLEGRVTIADGVASLDGQPVWPIAAEA